MPVIKIVDAAMIYPFAQVTGLFGRKEKARKLQQQKAMPYTSNEGVIALQHFSATIQDGEFVVLLGPSGSGKSTLLRLIAGLEDIPVGEIYFDDRLMNGVKPEERDVAMVFQNYSLYPALTVYENIAFPLQAAHTPREELDEKVRGIAGMLGLTEKLSRLPDDLSGGEKQRVAIARALVRRPQIFLMDEPFANLDQVMKSALRKEIKKIHKEMKTTFIYVTHDQSEALSLADRIIVLKDGIIQQDGSASDVYNFPTNRFVAEFIGSPSMNIFEDVPVNRTTHSLTLLGKQISLNSKQAAAKSLTAGIRPVHIAIADQGAEAEVIYTEIIGADLIIHCRYQGKDITVVEKMNESSEMKYLKGQKVFLIPQPDCIHLFDGQGNRI